MRKQVFFFQNWNSGSRKLSVLIRHLNTHVLNILWKHFKTKFSLDSGLVTGNFVFLSVKLDLREKRIFPVQPNSFSFLNHPRLTWLHAVNAFPADHTFPRLPLDCPVNWNNSASLDNLLKI